MFYVIVGFEHLLLGLKLVIGWLLPEEPKRVEEDIRYKTVLKDKVLSSKPVEHQGFRMRRQRQLFKVFQDRINRNKVAKGDVKEEGKSFYREHGSFLNLLLKKDKNEDSQTGQEKLKNDE
eukprot:TRINITY_DN11840_c0_g2_i13.p1 TRINITY_DN11840_c0_g2~~TRINITY_DN11840_c0_g2_i13.p1  ORF type:complete len:120 (+),score=26.29 TRINITY_DN11840_c0_g2_i13:258-617(+)